MASYWPYTQLLAALPTATSVFFDLVAREQEDLTMIPDSWFSEDNDSGDEEEWALQREKDTRECTIPSTVTFFHCDPIGLAVDGAQSVKVSNCMQQTVVSVLTCQPFCRVCQWTMFAHKPSLTTTSCQSCQTVIHSTCVSCPNGSGNVAWMPHWTLYFWRNSGHSSQLSRHWWLGTLSALGTLRYFGHCMKLAGSNQQLCL